MRSHSKSRMTPYQEILAEQHKEAKRRKRKREKQKQAGKPAFSAPFVAFDGEGEGDPHRYTLLACVDELGNVLAQAENPEGLSTYECLDLLTDVHYPSGDRVSRMVGFANGYDYTMMLADLKTRDIARLTRDDPKTGKAPWISVERKGVCRYSIQLTGKQLTLSRRDWRPAEKDYRGQKRSVILCDVFKFFQQSAVKAYADWQVYRDPKYDWACEALSGKKHPTLTREKTILDFVESMKANRDAFDCESKAKKDLYNRVETQGYADLARLVTNACAEAGFPLSDLYGAGSVAKAILREIGALECLPAVDRDGTPERQHAVRCAFFGGHFEISLCGPIKRPCWEADIASAYPYELFRLPCLKCGTWEKTTKRSDVMAATIALCRVTWSHPKSTLWGALPFRERDGTTIWPIESKGGVWVWRPEFDEAERIGGVTLKEAWIYNTQCDHKPFSRLPEMYRQRVAWGKEGRGKVLKLGMNALYGVTVQAVGSKKYQSMVWGGLITSGTRARLIEAIRRVGPEHVFMVATDAIYTTKDPSSYLPDPFDTGTKGLRDSDGQPKPPLGAWDVQRFEAGMFVVRPGIYFDLDGKTVKKLRSRGFSTSKLRAAIPAILETWEHDGAGSPVTIKERRFCGLKSGAYMTPRGEARRKEVYGQWYEHEMTISYDPRPKRAAVIEGRIVPWSHPNEPDAASFPYSKGLSDESPEGMRLEAARALADDQPDGENIGDDHA